jgi:hypothetical protein
MRKLLKVKFENGSICGNNCLTVISAKDREAVQNKFVKSAVTLYNKAF